MAGSGARPGAPRCEALRGVRRVAPLVRTAPDEVLIDRRDAVAPDAKDAAHETVAVGVADVAPGAQVVAVRVNGRGTECARSGRGRGSDDGKTVAGKADRSGWRPAQETVLTEIGGRGAVAPDGQMLDEPVRLSTVRTLARAGEAT